MRVLMIVGTGGFIGSVFRYFLSQFVQSKLEVPFPFGTFGVNILGCFVIGLVYAFGEKGNLDADWRLFLATGICGGFTTFSSFSNETLGLLRTGHTTYAMLYIVGSVVLGLLATFLAIALVRMA